MRKKGYTRLVAFGVWCELRFLACSELGGPSYTPRNIVTYNNALKSTTYVWYDITLQRQNITT